MQNSDGIEMEKLKSAGIKQYSDVPDNTDGIFLKTLPHYNRNYGFFTIETEKTKTAALKGIYTDNLRHIKGNPNFHSTEWSAIINTVSDIERVLKSPAETELFLAGGECYLKNIKLAEEERRYGDKRDYTVPRPLSSSEYSEPKSRMYDEEIILSSGFLGGIFPQVTSYFTQSVFNELPDILNPLFVSCNLKTSSPSIAFLYGRPYVNMTNLENMFKTIGLNKSLYRQSFSQQLYLKMKNHKLSKISKSYFPVTFKEIEELTGELEKSVRTVNSQNIVEKSFFEYPVRFMIVFEYLSVKLTDALSSLLKYFASVSDAVNAVFKTRENSIFYNKEAMELPLFIDFASPFEEVTFNIEKKTDKLKKHTAKIPFLKRKSLKIKKTVSQIHTLLDLRDRLYLTVSEFIKQTQGAMKVIADFGIRKGRFEKESDIFYMEYDEIRRISFDSFYGDAKELAAFRKWKEKRYEAQVVPPEIYGYDLSDTPHIAEDMILRFLDADEFAAFPVNDKSFEGEVENNPFADDYENKAIAAYNLPIPRLMKYKNAAGIIAENVSPFSLAAEFAVLNDIPLYAGVRYAAAFLDKRVRGEKGKIIRVND